MSEIQNCPNLVRGGINIFQKCPKFKNVPKVGGGGSTLIGTLSQIFSIFYFDGSPNRPWVMALRPSPKDGHHHPLQHFLTLWWVPWLLLKKAVFDTLIFEGGWIQKSLTRTNPLVQSAWAVAVGWGLSELGNMCARLLYLVLSKWNFESKKIWVEFFLNILVLRILILPRRGNKVWICLR